MEYMIFGQVIKLDLVGNPAAEVRRPNFSGEGLKIICLVHAQVIWGWLGWGLFRWSTEYYIKRAEDEAAW